MIDEAITPEMYLSDRRQRYASEWRPEYGENMMRLLEAVNGLIRQIKQYKPDFIWRVTSGWRPPSLNASVAGAAPRSRHMICEAVDLADPDCELGEWLMLNQDALASRRLAMEDLRWTRGWVHLQTPPPRSDKTVFQPYPGEPPANRIG